MPVYHDHYNEYLTAPPSSYKKRLFVGVDQGTENISELPVVGERGEFDIRHGRVNDGVGRQAVEDYLVGGEAVRRTRKEVRVIGTASATEHNRVIAAVQLINAALPEEAKLRVGPPIPGFSLRDTIDAEGYRYVSGEELQDTIHVEFVRGTAYYDVSGRSIATAWSDEISGYVLIDRNSKRQTNDHDSITLLAHELIHTLDMGHVSQYFDTILEGTGHIFGVEQQGSLKPLSLLWPVDREALRVLYGRLQDGDALTDFGPWSSVSTHVHGNGRHSGFGVALRNGYAEPWAYGYLPRQDLANNRNLTGSAAWNGTLLGFTPDAKPVAGNAWIGVNLGTLEGRADFTALESRAAGSAPGTAGTGSTWGDGTLGYSIAVRGNTFKQTGGDEGVLAGIFTGQNHQGAAGTLERSDLTAAFGASRQ
jgi:hypothetical protein